MISFSFPNIRIFHEKKLGQSMLNLYLFFCKNVNPCLRNFIETWHVDRKLKKNMFAKIPYLL